MVVYCCYGDADTQVNYLDIGIESKSQGNDDDAGTMYEGNTSDSYSSGVEDDNEVEGAVSL